MVKSFLFALKLCGEVSAFDPWLEEMKTKCVKTQLRALRRQLKVFFLISSRLVVKGGRETL